LVQGEARAARRQFEHDANELARTVIQPAFEAIGARLKADDGGGRSTSASTMAPTPTDSFCECPSKVRSPGRDRTAISFANLVVCPWPTTASTKGEALAPSCGLLKSSIASNEVLVVGWNQPSPVAPRVSYALSQ
jgi:hypothetical protein